MHSAVPNKREEKHYFLTQLLIENKSFVTGPRFELQIESVWLTKLYLDYRLAHLMLISFSWFERLTMTVILFNCVTLGMYQPCEDGNCETQRCKVLKVRFFFVHQMRPTAPITEIMPLLTKSSKGLLLYPSYLHLFLVDKESTGSIWFFATAFDLLAEIFEPNALYRMHKNYLCAFMPPYIT